MATDRDIMKMQLLNILQRGEENAIPGPELRRLLNVRDLRPYREIMEELVKHGDPQWAVIGDSAHGYYLARNRVEVSKSRADLLSRIRSLSKRCKALRDIEEAMPPQIAVKAHQKLIRDKMALTEGANNLFGKWWEFINTDISKSEIREIDYKTCEKIILDYEWLRCMPAVVWYMYGIYFDNNLGGVVCYGPEYSENLGIQAREQGRKCADWSKYGFENKMILLSRGACVHWAHPHAASKLIRSSMKLLPNKYEIVTCTVDEAAGEIGTIYQACGFHYVGSMRESNANVKSSYMDRAAWLIDGKLWPARSVRAICGSTKLEDIKKILPSG